MAPAYALRTYAALHDFTSDADAQDPSDTTGSGTPPSDGGGNPYASFLGSMGSRDPMSGMGDDDVADLVVNYNAKFASADPAMFRDGVVAQTMAVLIGKSKPNALLVGPAGTGKTRIAEEIARRIATGDPTVPSALQGTTVYELPLANLVAGSSLVGQLEQKARDIIGWMEDPDNKAVLFIDEIHMLASRDHIYKQVAQIFKPALARGDLRVIGATTTQEASDLATDPAFSRRFSRIIVDELTPDQTVEVMKSARASLFKHYSNKILLDDDVIEMVQRIADRHSAPGLHRPDNALTLLDRSCADAVMDRVAQEAQLAQTDPALLQTLRQSAPQVAVTERRVRKTAMLLMTGHASRERLDEQSLRDALSHIKGQDEAVERIVSMLRTRDLELFDDKRPLAVLMAGASGVGKTEVARTIAAELTGNEPIMLNMTEYSEPATVNRILGSPAGYVGSDSHEELPFDILQSNPHQVILLDELEKADRSVQRLFMSALEEGSLKTARGTVLDFSHAVVLATTNAGSGRAASRAIGFAPQSGNADAQAAASLSAWFDPEFLNRFQAVVQFSDISRDVYRGIVESTYEREAARILAERPRTPLEPKLSQDELDRLVEETYVPEFGARPALRAVKRTIEEAVLDAMQQQAQAQAASQTSDPDEKEDADAD